MMQTITSMQNPKVALWRSLKSRASRLSAGMYIVEGIKMVEEALAMGVARTLLVDMDRQAAFLPLIEKAPCEVYAVSAHILCSVCDTKTPQGVAALTSMPSPPELSALGPLTVVLDGVQDPGNVGTILRTADAAGFTGVLLSEECADPFSSKCLRATMGSIFRMPVLTCASLSEPLSRLRSEGYSLLSGELHGTPFYDRSGVEARLCLIIGSEGNGVSSAVSSLCTHRLSLPMLGGAESLNAAVAAGIMMYDIAHRS